MSNITGEHSLPSEQEALQAEIERLREEHNRSLADKEITVARLETDIVQAKAQAHVAQQELDEIHRSKAWRLVLEMRRLRLVFAPANSPLEKLLGLTNPRQTMEEKIQSSRHNDSNLEGLKQAQRRTSREKMLEFLERKSLFHLRQAAHPDLTILMVLYNQAELTYTCLRSLMTEVGERGEILLIDNASTDETGELLSNLEGVRCIRNPENVGFIRAVNQGVQEAHGKYVLLLNNDTELEPGSIQRALELIESNPKIGAVGGKVLLLDGYLQEAGSLVWNDGTCLGYARGRHPEIEEVMFRRDVDFISGVFLLTRRDLFLEMGGFDPRFAPAYYEDVDYCMRLWERGLRVVYEPSVIIHHYEYGSAGVSDRALAQMQKNCHIFFEKHAQALEKHYPPSEGNTLFARSRSNPKGRILFVDDLIPLPYHGAGLPRSRMMLQILQELGFFITVFPINVAQDHWEDVYKFLPAEIEVMLNHNVERIERFLEARRGYYDILFVSRPHNAQLMGRLKEQRPELFEGLFIIYDAEAIWILRDIERTRVFGVGKGLSESQVNKMVKNEIAHAAFADRITVVNDNEATHFRNTYDKDIRVLSHAIPSQPTPSGFDERQDLLFVGRLIEENAPNVDSMVWFVNSILPLIQRSLDSPVKLSIIGTIKARSVLNLAKHPNVELVGAVDETSSWYDRARVFVAPTRFSAGIPLKVIEAVSYGLPSVITPLLANQLGWKQETGVLIGKDATDFAEACASLYRDRKLWERVRDQGLQIIRDHYSYSAFAENVRRSFEIKR